MFCSKCGKQLGDNENFCSRCGTKAATNNYSSTPEIYEVENTQGSEHKRKPNTQTMMNNGQMVTPNIFYCEDGKYRWVYEMSLFKNPTIFILLWKILFFVILGIFIFVNIIDVFSSVDYFPEMFLNNLKFLGYFLLGMTIITILGYLLYAAIMGGKYIAVFEMDDKGILHKQLPKQAKKARVISALTVLAGLAGGRVSTVGIGLNTSRTEMYTSFSNIRKLKAYPKRNLIKLNERLYHNQIYAENEDFSFVYDFIKNHSDNLKHAKPY